jgi:1-deoxy-D-xylulose-5-phosphate reductoisomerase
MVEYEDGSIMAQMGSPDMRIPIQLALTYPKREKNSFSKLDILKCASLTFEAPDLEAFPCLKLAYDALNSGGTMPVVMNAANEVAVSMFLSGKISFQHIARIIDGIMNKHCVNTNPTLDDIIEADRWARETIGGVL